MQKAKGQKILIWAFAIFVLAFVLRIFHIAAIYKNSPFFAVLPGDLGAYDLWASQIVENGWLGKEIFYQDPLYPYFLAIFYKVVGREFLWIYVVQAFLGGCTSGLLVLLGAKVFSRNAGIFAGLMYGLYGPAIYFDGLLLKVSLSAFLFTLAIYLFLHKQLKEASPSIYFSGFFFGLACLTRANFLLLLPLGFFTVLVNPHTMLKKRIIITLLFVAGVLSALGPVVARNYVVGNELVLTTAQAGQNFYIGHNADANGTYIRLPFVRPDPLHEQEDFKNEAEKRTGSDLTPPEVSHFWLQQGLDFILDNPLTDFKLTGKKFLLFLNSYEIPDNHNFYFHQRYSNILQNLPINFGWLAPFFLLGLLGMLLEKRTESFFLAFVQIIYVASVIIFYVFSRYRMVALPLFCLSAGYGLYILTNLKLVEPLDFSHSFTDEGIAYERKNEAKKAINSYEQALGINPNYLRVLDRLGKLQLQQKQYNGARSTYTKILAIEPDSMDAKYQIMRLDKLGL